MSFAKPIFTTRGKQIELQGIEGQQIIFTKIKIGDGRITTQSPSQLTDLINVIAEAPITSLKRYDAYAAIRSVFQNIDVPEAFWWREVGLFATDPATGEEVLYAYQNAYDTAEYITPSSLVTKKINWTIYIDDGENLGADIHKKMVFCSVEDLDEHNDLEGAHEVAFTAHNADTGSHTDIRKKIGTDISSHNTSTSAHENRFNEFVKGVTGSNATLTITKGNGTTSTVTVNNVVNATNATKATQDSGGQQINSTYIKGLSVSGKTITYTKGNGTTGTITTQDTVYTHPNSGATAGTYRNVTVNAQGHVTAGSNPTTLAGYGITDGALKYELGETGGSAVYSMFGSCAADAQNGNISATIILTQGGNFGGSYQGAWLIQMSTRNAKSMSVKTLRTPSGGEPTFGYYVSGSTCYFGALFPAYRGNANITVLSNVGFTLKDFGDVSAAPSGWTKVTPEIMIDSGNYTSYLPAAKVALCGEVKWYAGKSVPSGWLLCNGATISRTTYSALYNVIGTTYGAGDGSTTFNLPLLTDNRFIEGSNTPGTQHKAGLPNITGSGALGTAASYNVSNCKGAIYRDGINKKYQETNGSNNGDTTYFDASRSNSIYGSSTTVQPQSLTMLPIIKY